MQRRVRANLHALAATDAPRKKICFIQRTRRAQQPFVAALAHARVGAHQRNHGNAGREAGERSAPSNQATQPHAPCGRSEKQGRHADKRPRNSCTSGTRPCATERRPIGSSPPWQCRRQRLQWVASSRILVQPQQRPARHRAQQRAQRTNRPAPQPRHAQTGRKNRNEQNPQEHALRVVRLAEIEHRIVQKCM